MSRSDEMKGECSITIVHSSNVDYSLVGVSGGDVCFEIGVCKRVCQ
jgi:hypothetical protein